MGDLWGSRGRVFEYRNGPHSADPDPGPDRDDTFPVPTDYTVSTTLNEFDLRSVPTEAPRVFRLPVGDRVPLRDLSGPPGCPSRRLPLLSSSPLSLDKRDVLLTPAPPWVKRWGRHFGPDGWVEPRGTGPGEPYSTKSGGKGTSTVWGGPKVRSRYLSGPEVTDDVGGH